jgi:hypothetical protein
MIRIHSSLGVVILNVLIMLSLPLKMGSYYLKVTPARSDQGRQIRDNHPF